MVFLTARNIIQGQPAIQVDVIAKFLGFIINAIYSVVSNITPVNALGISIIILTIITKVLMLPLSIKSQKSTERMQELNPEMEKIRKKYGNNPTEPEKQAQMQKEIRMLYAEKGIHPLGGCLPLFIQLPIFYALTQVMNHTYLYIKDIKTLYVDQIATTLIETITPTSGMEQVLVKEIMPMLVESKERFGIFRVFFRRAVDFDLLNPESLAQAVNKFSPSNWSNILGAIPSEFSQQLAELNLFLQDKNQIDMFFGLDLTASPGLFNWPGIIIPVLAAVFTFLSTYMMTRKQKSKLAENSQAASTQKVMLYFMPLFMGYIVSITPVGVGLYWITSYVFQIFQQIMMDKFYFPKKENNK